MPPDSLRWLYPAECRNLRKFATDAHSVKRFLSKCANWDRKKPSFVSLPGAVADIWCTSQKRCQAQSIIKKTYLIALAYEVFQAFDWVTNQQISTWSDQVIQSDRFTPWRSLRSLSLAKGSKGSLNNPKMVTTNCPGTWSNKFLPHLNSSSCSKATRTDNLLERMPYTQQGSEHISGRLGTAEILLGFRAVKT